MGSVNYPFADTSTLVNSSGDFFAPDTFIDAALYPIGNGSRLYVSKVVITNSSCEMTLGSENTEDLATGSFDFADVLALADSDRFILRFYDDYERPAGIIVSDKVRLAIFQTWLVGTHAFELEQTELAATVSFPTPQEGVRGFSLEDGSYFAGDVWIVGEDGVVVTGETLNIIDEDGDMDSYNVIRVDIVGDPLFQRRLCDSPGYFQTPKFIQTVTMINSCRRVVLTPDDRGSINITAGNNDVEDSVLRIRPLVNGMLIEAVGETLGNVSN